MGMFTLKPSETHTSIEISNYSQQYASYRKISVLDSIVIRQSNKSVISSYSDVQAARMSILLILIIRRKYTIVKIP